MRILLTGCAGFIGFHFARRLLQRGDEVLGVDNLNDYYDVGLKEARLAKLVSQANFRFLKGDVADRSLMRDAFKEFQPRRVVHLAAQAGVRYSIKNPETYIDSNLVGFGAILEGCRHARVEHLVYASSSSVYGSNLVLPFSVEHNVDHPLSLYAATKKANELMAHTYSHLFALPTTGLRFFTVYGPWGRPDMAVFLFTKAILEGRPIDLFNEGRMMRDFTYVDDIVEGIERVSHRVPRPDPDYDMRRNHPGLSTAPYRIYNIGNSKPVPLMELVSALEEALGKQATKRMVPMQLGDLHSSDADVAEFERDMNFRPQTSLQQGIRAFVEWYRQYYRI